MEKPTFFARRALLILVIVFFFTPFALRGARMALMGMKNDVKDWLPKEFEETKDLDEFRRYFLSEQFVLVSWDGCYGDENDERFKLFLAKLMPELPPSARQRKGDAGQRIQTAEHAPGATEGLLADDSFQGAGDAEGESEPKEPAVDANPTRYIHSEENFIGDRLGLYYAGDWHENWGGRRERWLKGLRLEREDSNEEAWYYITPEGDLFRWDGVDSPFAALARAIYRGLTDEKVEGTLVHSFGPSDGAFYYSDPRRLRAQLFKTITTGPDVLESLVREGGELAGDPEEARRRLSGVLFGPDGKTTCIMLTLTDAARRNLHLVVGRGLLGKPRGLLYEISEESNISESELRLGGPPVDNVAIDEEGSITLVRLVSFSAFLGIALSLLCFRSISATIIILFVGGISAIMSLAFVWWLGSSVDAIMMSMPSLVYVLGLSGAAHIINYYNQAITDHGYRGAPERAIAAGWRPAVFCNVTTAIGLVALVTSELVPIRKFGLFSAIGVMATLVILFTYLPAALQLWPQKRKKKPHRDEPTWLASSLDIFWQRMGSFIIRHNMATAIVCTLIIAAVGYGVVHMRTSVNLLKMFHADAKIIKDYEWLEQNLGHLVPMEIVVRVPRDEQCPSNSELRALQEELASVHTTPERRSEIERILHEARFQLTFLERMELAARVQGLIEREFGPEGRDVVGRAVSAATFVRPLPAAGGSTLARSLRNSTSGRLEAHRDEFLHSDYLRVTSEDQTELWRVSLRVGATKGIDYGAFVSDLQQTVEPVIAAQRERQTILRQLAELYKVRGEPDRALASSRVLMIGMPPASDLAQGESGKERSEAQSAAAATPSFASAKPVDQRRIFTMTLLEMLINARLRLDTSLTNDQPLPSDLDEKLADYDCVVVVGDVPGLDLKVIKLAAPLVIDARDYRFQPGGQQQTAWRSDPSSIAAVYTGVVPIVYKAQRMLLDSLIESTFWSILTITPLLMFIARSVTAGSVAMLPNILPILMVFGGMGWLGVDVDVGSMMTASIALGVAVDDTIHFLNWFRVELDRLGDRKKAILAAYTHCATPTLQAAVISGLGLSIFAFSTFTPTQRFGCLMLIILWLGAIAELIYFPALLAGPLGMVFKPRRHADSDAERLDAESQVSETVRPVQLQVVRGDEGEELPDESSDDLAAVASARDDAHTIPHPHTGSPSASPGSVRGDAKRRRG